MVLRLHVLARVANQAGGELRVLHAHVFLAAFAQRAAVKANDGGMAEIGVDAVEAGGIGHRHVDVVHPRHGLGHHDLLVLGGVHIALAAHDQFGAAHGAIAPDLRIIAVVADDEADLQAFGTFRYIGAVARVPALYRHPRHDLAVLLHDLALVVHQDERVVRRLVRMLFMALSRQREHAPHVGLAAGIGEHRGLFARNRRRGFVHFLGVVHDAVGGVLGENDQVHSGQAALHAHDHVGDLAGVLHHLRSGMQPRHLVVHDGHAHAIVAAGDISVSHDNAPR